jgi:hypothetical protein
LIMGNLLGSVSDDRESGCGVTARRTCIAQDSGASNVLRSSQ